MELLEKLCRASGISGFETEVQEIMKKEFEKSCDKVEIDNFGNVIAKKGKGKKKIMLAAHMDEIGLMVKHIDKRGFLNFVKIGGIDDRILMQQRVIIKTKKGDVKGVIGAKPPHLQKAEEKKEVIKHGKLFIDIGAKDDKEAKKMVEVGDPVTLEPNFGKLNKSIYYGKALDDRLGCYALIKIMRQIKVKDVTIYAVATAQEELGLKGARVSAFKIDPDYALAIDTLVAGDTPYIEESESSLELRKGPAITIMEASGRGAVTHPKIRKILINVAKEKKIPYQIDVLEGGMTDAAVIYISKEGIPTGVVSIPTRYIHGPSGIFSMDDVNNSIKLVMEALPNF
ncbi:peptidase M42 [Candidatus Altiarchaeales archaeon WOR_SM1_SCG]|nr:peptidase M42 [Candidatus Altiarchaeales archaeon WOR_SM1_SCG]